MPKLLTLAGAALAALTPSLGLAHSAPAGWHYDAWCCSGRDCAPIPEDEVRITPEGYLVTIPAESTRDRLQKLFPYDKVRMSGDGQYHACILPGSGDFRCLYVPPMGY
jgi:hypothetical protein